MKFQEDKLFNPPPGLKYLYSLQGRVMFNSEGYASIENIDWSPDGKMLAVAKTNQIVEIWNLNSGKFPYVINTSEEESASSNKGGTVTFVAWSFDSKYLATLTELSHIEVWDITTFKIEWIFNSNNYIISDCAWCPNGKYFAFSCEDETVWILNAKNGKFIRKLEGHENEVNCIAWSPDGTTIASGSEDKTVKLWNVKTGNSFAIIIVQLGAIYDLAWSPDGKILAISDRHNKNIKLWNIEKQKLDIVLEGHTDSNINLSFSQDGTYLASKSRDRTVRLWSCQSWKTVALLPINIQNVFNDVLAFHPNSSLLATTGNSEIVVDIWKIDKDILNGNYEVDESIKYINIKAVLIGESGVGKSGLGIQISEKVFRETKSTHGAQFWQISIPNNKLPAKLREDKVQAEITLWDLAGQPDYHLIHQLFLDHIELLLKNKKNYKIL